MKTLEEIKDEYAREIGFDDWNEIIYSHESDEIEHHSIIISKRFSIEVSKEALKNAYDKLEYEYGDYEEQVDYSFITSETNIPKL